VQLLERCDNSDNGEMVEMVELKFEVENKGEKEEGKENGEGDCYQWQDTLVREVSY